MSLPSPGDLKSIPVATVPVALLVPSDSLRVNGVDPEHVRTLAETDGVIPPILVHRVTMRVVDGMHRLHAAVRRGDETIEVRFVNGMERDLFVLAVKSNATHGLPLSKQDRVAAATRVVSSHAEWSDRMIAELTGLSAKTVAAIRKRSTADVRPVAGRIGRDGKVRPISTVQGRQLAGAILAERPEASLREVARETQLSLGTVRDVRMRLCRGEDPVPDRLRALDDNVAKNGVVARTAALPSLPAEQLSALLALLKKDPSLRFSDSGKAVLRLLDSHSISGETWTQLAESVPAHCVETVANLARSCAAAWGRFAQQIETRGTMPYSKVGS